MKIVFLADSISTQSAGIHYYGMQLIEQFLVEYPNYDFSLVASRKIDSIPIEQIIVPIKPGIPLHIRIRQFWSIPKILRRIKPDLVIELAHFGPFNLPASIDRATVIHDLTPVTHPQYHSWASSMAHKMLIPGILRKANHIITNSQTTKNAISNKYGISGKRIHVIYPSMGVNFQETEKKKIPYTPYFLSVGTLEPRKNYLNLIKAFEYFAEKNPAFHLVIAGGKGWDYSKIYHAAEHSIYRDRIHITGYLNRNELMQLYQQAYAFVSASIYEGLGMPVGEALASSLPVIVSDIEAYRELADNAGMFFNPADPTKLADLFKQIAEDKVLLNERIELSKFKFKKIEETKNDLGFLHV